MLGSYDALLHLFDKSEAGDGEGGAETIRWKDKKRSEESRQMQSGKSRHPIGIKLFKGSERKHDKKYRVRENEILIQKYANASSAYD